MTDDYVGYNNHPEHKRQLCWAHLLRHFISISTRGGRAVRVGTGLLLVGYAIYRTWHRWQEQQISDVIYKRRINRLRVSFHRLLESGSRLRIDTRTKRQCDHLIKREPMCFTFLNDARIPLDNNSAERAVRRYVIWRKLSYFSQSYRGDQFRPIIMRASPRADHQQVASEAGCSEFAGRVLSPEISIVVVR